MRTAAINAVLKNHEIPCDALCRINAETHDEYGVKAGGFFAQMEKFSTFFGLKLSHLVYAASEQLSLHSKAETPQYKRQSTLQHCAEATLQVCALLRSLKCFTSQL